MRQFRVGRPTCGALLALLLVVPPPAVVTAGTPDSAAVRDVLRRTQEKWQAPGIAAAVVRDDKVIFECVGVRERGGDRPVTPDTLFGIGSCTKAFTATALGILVDEGRADWDDPVRKHLPWFRLDDPLADRDVRLRDLLCHRIGLARHDLLWYRAPWDVEESVRRMAFLPRQTSFRSTYEYNNLAYLAAGLAVSAAAKMPWHEFVRERLFRPLGMKNAVFTRSDALKSPNHASPHGRDDSGEVTVLPWYDDDKQIRASGSIKASARDLSQWVRFQLGGRAYDGDRPPVSPESLSQTHAPQTVVPLTAADRAAGAIQSSYGLGWQIRDYRGHGVQEHSGAVDGFRARVILVPKEKLGIVLLTNLEQNEVVSAAGNTLLDRLLGLREKDWDDFFLRQHLLAKLARTDWLDRRLRGRVRGTHARGLDLYVGMYSEPAYGTVTIRRDGEELVLAWSNFRLPLKHFHYDTFLTPQDRRLPEEVQAEPVTFEMNEDAEMAVLRFLGRKFTRDRPRKKDQEK